MIEMLKQVAITMSLSNMKGLFKKKKERVKYERYPLLVDSIFLASTIDSIDGF
jgi:hypothetical protein